jgi:hypothetical protein
MINWTGPALMIAGAILVVFCESLLVWRQRSLAAMQTQPANLSSVIGGLEAARVVPNIMTAVCRSNFLRGPGRREAARACHGIFIWGLVVLAAW